MDHLPQLIRPSSRLPETPFYTQYRYENAKEGSQLPSTPVHIKNRYDVHGLRDFPDVNNYQFGRRCQDGDDDSAFFQAWLYFGTLMEVLRTHGISVDARDFCKEDCKGGLVLTTRCLNDYIAAWVVTGSREHGGILEKSAFHHKARITGQGIGENAGRFVGRAIVQLQGRTPAPEQNEPRLHSAGIRSITEDRAFRIHSILRAVARILADLASSFESVRDTVWDSVLILCWTLQTAAYYLYRSYNFTFSFAKLFDKIPPRQLEHLFNENGWCQRERKIIRNIAEGDNCVLFLSAQLNRREEKADHSRCDITMCHAYQVEELNYRTLHVSSECNCEFVGFGKSKGGFLSAISEAVSQPAKTTLNLPSSPMIKYENGRIQLVEVVLARRDANQYKMPFGQAFAAISHVWAHGLGNPHANDLPRCQVERIQDQVNALFPNEHNPVPFWIDTLCIPVDEESRKKALVRMEAVYKTATKILVLDRTLFEVSTSDMSPEEIGLRIMCSPWARRLWTLSEGSFQTRVVYKFQDSFHRYDDLNNAVRAMHAFPGRRRVIPQNHFLNTVLADPPNCQTRLDPLWKHAHKALNCAWPKISTFFKEMSIGYQPADLEWLPGTQLNPWIQITVPRAIRTVMSRTTSKAKDECRVFASLTHWWSGSAKMFEGVDPSEHYRKYFRNFGCAPTQLIFLNQKRYEEDGCRWIPKSLLSQTWPDCDLMDFEHKLWDDEFGWQNSQGLEVEYPGYMLTWDRRCSLTLPGSSYFNLGDMMCEARVYEAGTKAYPSNSPSGNNVAIIVPRYIWQHPAKFTGVLVTIYDNPPSRLASSAVGSGWTDIRATMYGAVRNAVMGYRNRDRIFVRHEALVELTDVSSNRVERVVGLPSKMPLVDGHPIDYCRSSKGDGKNNRWRVG